MTAEKTEEKYPVTFKALQREIARLKEHRFWLGVALFLTVLISAWIISGAPGINNPSPGPVCVPCGPRCAPLNQLPPCPPPPPQYLGVYWNANNSVYEKYLTHSATRVTATIATVDVNTTLIVREIDDMSCLIPADSNGNMLGCASLSALQYQTPMYVQVTIQVKANITVPVYIVSTPVLTFPFQTCSGHVTQILNTVYAGITSTRKVPEICLN